MNQNLGLIGRKLGCTQVFEDDGRVTSVTVIEAGPCVVVGKRTPELHGYSALQLGFGTRREKLVRKPQQVAFAKIGVAVPKVVREFRLPAEVVAKYEVGQTISAKDVFAAGQKVDVTGTTKGRGFTGVMKRHNFHGSATVTHGSHEYKRHGGSIGQRKTPGRTFLNMKMPGQYGNEQQTIMALGVARVLEDESYVLVHGGVPGPTGGVVMIRPTVKAPVKTAPAKA
jgi:large subunit ribosomal protein L3